MITKKLFKKIISGKVSREELDSLELLDYQKDIIFDKIKNGGGDGGNDFLSDWIKKHNWIKYDFALNNEGGYYDFADEFLLPAIKSDDMEDACEVYNGVDITSIATSTGITYMALTKERFIQNTYAYDADDSSINISNDVIEVTFDEVINFVKNHFK